MLLAAAYGGTLIGARIVGERGFELWSAEFWVFVLGFTILRPLFYWIWPKRKPRATSSLP